MSMIGYAEPDGLEVVAGFKDDVGRAGVVEGSSLTFLLGGDRADSGGSWGIWKGAEAILVVACT